MLLLSCVDILDNCKMEKAWLLMVCFSVGPASKMSIESALDSGACAVNGRVVADESKMGVVIFDKERD